ncbi:MAG TPA: GNAT family N-acetyltransferase [Candidatus Limnocylindrales bacterium]|nr:GNAT family N-acetyltransferase [Candidatus Limnocylindrales bacterium]
MDPEAATPIGRPRLRRLATDDLTPAEVTAIRAMLVAAFGRGEDDAFGEDDWTHALGGVHFLLDIDGDVVSHAAVVERTLEVAGRSFRTGYVEAVATSPDRQGRGYGSQVMTDATAHIRETFELGALGTGRHHFYERLGWSTWRGPAYVRTPTGVLRTPDDEGYILVLATPSSPGLDPTAPITCEWRPGDVW